MPRVRYAPGLPRESVQILKSLCRYCAPSRLNELIRQGRDATRKSKFQNDFSGLRGKCPRWLGYRKQAPFCSSPIARSKLPITHARL